ncbi:hypothetical protein SRHO_G00048930 [Serrasalmus rhombeus]
MSPGQPRFQPVLIGLVTWRPDSDRPYSVCAECFCCFSVAIRRSQVIERFETQQSADGLEHMDTTCSSAEQSSSSPKASSERTGRSERRLPAQKQDLSLDASTAVQCQTSLGRHWPATGGPRVWTAE